MPRSQLESVVILDFFSTLPIYSTYTHVFSLFHVSYYVHRWGLVTINSTLNVHSELWKIAWFGVTVVICVFCVSHKIAKIARRINYNIICLSTIDACFSCSVFIFCCCCYPINRQIGWEHIHIWNNLLLTQSAWIKQNVWLFFSFSCMFAHLFLRHSVWLTKYRIYQIIIVWVSRNIFYVNNILV